MYSDPLALASAPALASTAQNMASFRSSDTTSSRTSWRYILQTVSIPANVDCMPFVMYCTN